jgi:hypothetical protein
MSERRVVTATYDAIPGEEALMHDITEACLYDQARKMGCKVVEPIRSEREASHEHWATLRRWPRVTLYAEVEPLETTS